MMVIYARTRGYSGSGRDPLLTIGHEHIILGIVFRPAPYSTQVCIQTDVDAGDHLDGTPYSDGGPGLFDMAFFDVVDPRIPPGWLMADMGDGYYRLGPSEFDGDFWDRFHDGDPDAEKLFEQVVEKLKVFHESRPC